MSQLRRTASGKRSRSCSTSRFRMGHWKRWPIYRSRNSRSACRIIKGVKKPIGKSGIAGILGKTFVGVHTVRPSRSGDVIVESKSRFPACNLLGSCNHCGARHHDIKQARREEEGRRGKRTFQIGSSGAAQERAYANPSPGSARRPRFDVGQGSNGAHLSKLPHARWQRHRHEPSRRDDGVADQRRIGGRKE